MCNPVALLAVTTLASTAMQYKGAQDQAKSQQRFAKRQAEEGAALARADFDLQNQVLAERDQQEQEAASQAVTEVQREAAQARASTRVAAGEAGVAGLSVDALLAEFDMQEAAAVYNIKRNRQHSVSQADLSRKGIRAQTAQNIGRTRYAPISRPSLVAHGLQAAGDAAGLYAKYKT